MDLKSVSVCIYSVDFTLQFLVIGSEVDHKRQGRYDAKAYWLIFLVITYLCTCVERNNVWFSYSKITSALTGFKQGTHRSQNIFIPLHHLYDVHRMFVFHFRTFQLTVYVSRILLYKTCFCQWELTGWKIMGKSYTYITWTTQKKPCGFKRQFFTICKSFLLLLLVEYEIKLICIKDLNIVLTLTVNSV